MKENLSVDVPHKIAAEATETLGGAVASAENLSTGLKAQMLDIANGAFVSGMQLNALIAAILAAGLAVLAASLLKQKGDTLH